MARKAWDQLSAGYRARLERQGITQEQHASGVSLHKARGHTSASAESQSSKERRSISRWATQYARFYGRDVDDVKETLAEYDRQSVLDAIALQTQSQKLYHEGRIAEAKARWETRDRDLPDWMFYYHGYFS